MLPPDEPFRLEEKRNAFFRDVPDGEVKCFLRMSRPERRQLLLFPKPDLFFIV